MHLDERLEKSREVIGKQIAVGQQKVSSAFNNLWAEMEAMREAQRKRQEEQRLAAEKEPKTTEASQGQANVQGASTRASAYISSWGTWASEKRKGWGAKSASSSPTEPTPGDLKRAEEFKREEKREKYKSLGSDSMNSSISGSTDGYDHGEKRSSLFFDAEREGGGVIGPGMEKNVWADDN